MRVIFDVSFLGRTVHRPYIYSGIARVVENYARELATRGDIDLSYYAGENLPECLRFKDGLLGDRIVGAGNSSAIIRSIGWSSGRFLNTTLSNRSPAMRAARYLTRLAVTPLREKWASAGTALAADVFHTPFGPIPASVRAAKKTKRFVTIYDLTPRLFPQWTTPGIIAEFDRILNALNEETYCLCISNATRDDLCTHTRVNPARCSVIYLAAEAQYRPCLDQIELSRVRGKYKLPDGKILLSLSALEPRKNIPAIIQAFTELVRSNAARDTYLVLAGHKSWKFDAIFEAATADAAIRRRIIFTGFIDEHDMPALYSIATAFVYVSFYEGFGLPVLEAMRCGTPVITSNCSSLPEVAGKAAVLVDPKDVNTIAAAMVRLLENETARDQLRNEGLKRAELFSWTRTINKTVQAYTGERQTESEINP